MNKQYDLTGKKVTTYDNHNGIVISNWYATGFGIMVKIQELDGRIWKCPYNDIVEVSNE